MPQPVTFILDPEARPEFDFLAVRHADVMSFQPMTVAAETWLRDTYPDAPLDYGTVLVPLDLAEWFGNVVITEGFRI